jgi:hypothetical protein
MSKKRRKLPWKTINIQNGEKVKVGATTCIRSKLEKRRPFFLSSWHFVLRFDLLEWVESIASNVMQDSFQIQLILEIK